VVTCFQLAVSANLDLKFAVEKKTAQDKERTVSSSWGGGGLEVFRPACTSDMSVFDVLVHKMGASAAKIRLDQLNESENKAA